MEKKADFWFGVYWGRSFLSLLMELWSLIVLVVFFVLAFINEREWNFFLACWWIPMVALFTDMVPLLMVGLERGWSVWWCYSVVWTTFVKHHFSLVTRWGSLHDSVFWEQPEINDLRWYLSRKSMFRSVKFLERRGFFFGAHWSTTFVEDLIFLLHVLYLGHAFVI